MKIVDGKQVEAEMREEFRRYIDAVRVALDAERWSDSMVQDARGALLCILEMERREAVHWQMPLSRADLATDYWGLHEAFDRWLDAIMFTAESEGLDSTVFRGGGRFDLVQAEAVLYRLELRIAAREGTGLPADDPSPTGSLFILLEIYRLDGYDFDNSGDEQAGERGVWTQQKLMKWGPGSDRIDPRTFGKVRVAAGVEASPQGYRGQTRLYTPTELRAMIDAVNETDHINRREARDYWKKLLAERA
jgi:hypothetical protein